MFRYGRLAEEYNLEQQYRKPFAEVWKEERDNPVFGPLSERMSVRARDGGRLLVGDEEMEAASMSDPMVVFISTEGNADRALLRFLSCVLLL